MPNTLPILQTDDIEQEQASHVAGLSNLAALHADGIVPGGWWHREGDRIECDLCPRRCVMKEGDRGFCFVRQNVGGQMMLTTYGRSTGFCIDPIEKKPLNHFLPGTSVLSFGTAGCNLGCKFCQNWDISKSRETERLSQRALPDEIARAALEMGCASVAFTYNDPVIWAEYAIDTALACKELGIKSVAVTAGYITPEARGPFYQFMDAANVDLKAFTEEFYYRTTLSHLQPVLDTLRWLKHETDVWFEITNLVIPQANDSLDEIKQMSDWLLDAVGDEVPLHFSAFHPDFRMLDRPRTPHETLIAARDVAMQAGLKYVYVGNVDDVARQSTFCPNCKKPLIERNWYELGEYALNRNRCRHCGTHIAGVFATRPGNWGRKRQPVDMRQFHSPDRDKPLVLPERPLQQASMRVSESEECGDSPSPSRPRTLTQSTAQPRNAPPGTITVQIPKTAPNLSPTQRQILFATAAELVRAAAEGRAPETSAFDRSGMRLNVVSGVFVSLKRRRRLRSCCGSFGQAMQLNQCLREAANRTATNDPRFPKVSVSELPHLDLDVWLLFAPEQVTERGLDRIQAVTIGKHGLQIIRGQQRGLLLPGVATDNDWDSEEFLNQVCVKAGLPPTAWKSDDTVLFRFEGDVIHGPMSSAGLMSVSVPPRPLLTPSEFEQLTHFARQSVDSLLRGMTPLYFCPGVPDTDVHGVAVKITQPGTDFWLSVARMSSKEKYPLQTTLFTQCETLAKALAGRNRPLDKLRVDILALDDTAMHGTIAEPDLSGIDSGTRGVLITERNKQGFVFDCRSSAEQLVRDAGQVAQVVAPEWSQIFSLRTLCSCDRFTIEMTPKPAGGGDVRPAAVAGRFYPGDAAEVARELDRMLGSGEPERQTVSAAMVPHAGWVYSGKLAADVLKRIELPRTVIIIGPKHTPNGLDWAVAPNRVWQFPGGQLESDLELARSLVAAVPGLQFDAAAHQQEHGIEVELPIIHRLAPQTKVVGICVSGASLSRCEDFARGLAAVLENFLLDPPLLLISSDMNHHANDAETRRLDSLALAQFDHLNEDLLFETCQSNHISMCGLVPAVIVMKTLKQLGQLKRSIEVGYGTSADASGDTSRCVGYAGRLLV
ncbi:MAG: AmmeMemoRadiSam system radical SAM enzyme [Planctomycetes bacterium]|nr:AmmeMemoRadiSam system radical SAM enzyme [Planctomycetota bacterium]